MIVGGFLNLGAAIRACRETRKYSQADLARKSGISVSHLCLLEKDKREPSLSAVEAIAGALQLPASILLFLAADPDQLKELSVTQIEHLSNGFRDLMANVARQKALF